MSDKSIFSRLPLHTSIAIAFVTTESSYELMVENSLTIALFSVVPSGSYGQIQSEEGENEKELSIAPLQKPEPRSKVCNAGKGEAQREQGMKKKIKKVINWMQYWSVLPCAV